MSYQFQQFAILLTGAEECKRNGGSLKCPLCRVVWKAAESGRGGSLGHLMIEIPREYAQVAENWSRVSIFTPQCKRD